MRLVLRRDAQMVKNERVDVAVNFNIFCGAAGAVARFCLDADQHGVVMTRQRLQSRGVFEGMGGHNSIVVISGSDQRGRIFHARTNIVDW